MVVLNDASFCLFRESVARTVISHAPSAVIFLGMLTVPVMLVPDPDGVNV